MAAALPAKAGGATQNASFPPWKATILTWQFCGHEGPLYYVKRPRRRSPAAFMLPVGLLSTRWDLDQLRELVFGQLRRGVFQLHGVFHDRVETGHLVRINRRLGKEIVARAL